MAFTEKGQSVQTPAGIPAPGDTWNLDEVARTCQKVVHVPYPEILTTLETEYPILSAVDPENYPKVLLRRRQIKQNSGRGKNAGLASLILFYEQTEPDDADSDDPVPDPEITQEGAWVLKSLGEHPDVRQGLPMKEWWDAEAGRMKDTPEVPEEIRNRSEYPESSWRVRVVTYSATALDAPRLHLRGDPPLDAGQLPPLGGWMITDGTVGKRGRWHTRTEVYTWDPGGWSDDIYQPLS